MGGRPVLALNLTAWPGGTLPLSILADVLRGGASVAAAAGCLVVGGHTIDDPEPNTAWRSSASPPVAAVHDRRRAAR